MDPLSALSIAASVVQFIDFSSKLVSGSRKLYKLSEGLDEGYEDLEQVTENLVNLSDELQRSMQTDTSKQTRSHEQELRTLCKGCNEVAKDLLGVLEKLKLDKDNARWRNCLQALKSVWGMDRVKDLEERVDGFRQQIAMNILVSLRFE